MNYQRLDPAKIRATADRLARRIGERFPDSGLAAIGLELAELTEKTTTHAESLHAPMWWLRILIAAVVLAGAGLFLFVGTFLSFDRIETGGFDFVQGVEAAVNTAVLAGIGLVTLMRLEERIKRRRVFSGLHRLRSMIHIIDMHQLTKDPAVVMSRSEPTASSPVRNLTRTQLTRYLDYCSEMLSLTGKLAALYAQSVDDGVVVNAVNDVENLGSNLSRKIWQKIMLIGPVDPAVAQPGG